jgi:hypothetical protein
VVERISARSVSLRLLPLLRDPLFQGSVLAVFRRACVLADSAGRVLTLILPELSPGPLSIQIVAQRGVFDDLAAGMAAKVIGLGQESLADATPLPAAPGGGALAGRPRQIGGGRLSGRLLAGDLEVDLKPAALWDPSPDWPAIRASQAHVRTNLPGARNLAARAAPAGLLLRLLSHPGAEPGPPVEEGLDAHVLRTVHVGAQQIAAGWEGQRDLLRAGAASLAGLGAGLTPAGDDFVAGLMLWAWCVHPEPSPLCAALLEEAGPRTSLISKALLQAAAGGACDAAWHGLLAALASESGHGLETHLRRVLATGSTSGADTLAGFLWLEASPSPSAARDDT